MHVGPLVALDVNDHTLETRTIFIDIRVFKRSVS